MKNDIEIKTSTDNIDFGEVSEILNFYGLSDYGKEIQKQIFQNSYAVVFLKKDNRIVGVGRAISDGITQAAIYNIAVRDSYRGKGYGKLIVDELVKQLTGCNIVLYTHPKHIGLYEHWGFSRLHTAYARYIDETHYREEGFID
ncbi:Acetyltransferase (GNAT) domain-containing protein [Lachnospiraceae bacterium RM5]|nr:Acetyltransferase (GNAT) domain-containing protein [Lachnospiraceae bacterium RM5]